MLVNCVGVLVEAAAPELTAVRARGVRGQPVATEMNQGQGTQAVGEGVRVIVEFATLEDNGPSGEFYNDHCPDSW